ncbi:MAG: XRE family transcriptional regulator [Rhodospirillales bacterium]|nr:XRE family transcriptional regulator [Rhodospirillales bacterium]MYH32986.1 XRE family transcriptional regulator [Gammaproteobacteria bacterium]
MSESEFELIEGSGNIYRDLGDPEADLKHAKAVLAARIIMTLDDRGLSVRKAAALTRFAAADFSRIRNADLGRFTLDRLMKMLAALDRDLQITVHVDSRRQAESAMVT